MSSESWSATATSAAANIEIVPIGRTHLAGFHAAVDKIAKERRYLTMLEAPSFTRTRRVVLESLKAGAVHVVAVVEGEVAHDQRDQDQHALHPAHGAGINGEERHRQRVAPVLDGVDYDALLMARLAP